MLNRRQFLAAPLPLLAGTRAFAAPKPPNIVYMYADDLGYGDTSCYGAARVKTPNLDRAAAATHEMLVSCALKLMRRNGKNPGNIDWLLPIQTHAGLIEGVARTLEWAEVARVAVVIEDHIPVQLLQIHQPNTCCARFSALVSCATSSSVL